MWYKFVDKNLQVKSHLVNEALAEELAKDLNLRYGAETENGKCEQVKETPRFELGGYGMYHVNQPRMALRVGDNKLRIDCRQFLEMITSLYNAKPKTLPKGEKYYKLYSRFWCLVLSPVERVELLQQLRANLEKANEKADAFFDAAEKRWQKMSQDYEKEHGRPFPVVRAQDVKTKNALKN